MHHTVKHTSVRLTKETLRQLLELQEELGEDKTAVIVRAIAYLHRAKFKEEK